MARSAVKVEPLDKSVRIYAERGTPYAGSIKFNLQLALLYEKSKWPQGANYAEASRAWRAIAGAIDNKALKERVMMRADENMQRSSVARSMEPKSLARG
ncbi:MAG: hypothetical protein KGH69_04310 [Candidatus Micrarchaeota archaeon]|nr:hypothetical protein [Candidatus Micrarchaeota archaeon]